MSWKGKALEAGFLGKGLWLCVCLGSHLPRGYSAGGTGSEWSVTIPGSVKTQCSSQVVMVHRLLWTLGFWNDQGGGSKNVNPCRGLHKN